MLHQSVDCHIYGVTLRLTTYIIIAIAANNIVSVINVLTRTIFTRSIVCHKIINPYTSFRSCDVLTRLVGIADANFRYILTKTVRRFPALFQAAILYTVSPRPAAGR